MIANLFYFDHFLAIVPPWRDLMLWLVRYDAISARLSTLHDTILPCMKLHALAALMSRSRFEVDAPGFVAMANVQDLVLF